MSNTQSNKPGQKTIIVIGAGTTGLAETVIRKIKDEFGDDSIIMTNQEAAGKGIRMPEKPDANSMATWGKKIAPELKQIEHPLQYQVPREHENQPWYNQFNKKRNKKR